MQMQPLLVVLEGDLSSYTGDQLAEGIRLAAVRDGWGVHSVTTIRYTIEVPEGMVTADA